MKYYNDLKHSSQSIQVLFIWNWGIWLISYNILNSFNKIRSSSSDIDAKVCFDFWLNPTKLAKIRIELTPSNFWSGIYDKIVGTYLCHFDRRHSKGPDIHLQMHLKGHLQSWHGKPVPFPLEYLLLLEPIGKHSLLFS